MNRRGFFSGLGFALAFAAPGLARAGEADWAPLPEGLAPGNAPGLSWTGSGPAAIEIFDYNCPYCRSVFQMLDQRAAKSGALRLGLIDSPQLSIGSIQAAKLRQAALLLYGPAKAYAYHRRIFAHRGAIDGETALAAAREMRFDIAKLAEAADGDAVRDILIAQSHFLNRAGVRATPAFIIGDRIMSGWPGPAAFDVALKNDG
jgi:protein-disulfide isomerase